MSKIREKLIRLIFLVSLLTQIFIPFNAVRDISALRPSQQDAIITGNLDTSRSGASTYITGIWGIDATELRSLTDNQMNYEGFVSAIEKYFLPQNIHFVLLWTTVWQDHANTSSQNIVYKSWIDDWLTACDIYGISNVFYLRQWAATSPEPSWDWDVYQQFPDMQTFNKSGYPINPNTARQIIPGTKKPGGWYAPDDPRFFYQLKEDLKQLYSYYGEHPSWVGIGTHFGDYGTYGARDTSTRDVGWGNFTIRNFADSIFYLRDVNATGYHHDGTKCKIWEMFIENENPIKLESVNWQDTEPLDIYGGTETGGRAVALKLEAPANLDGFKIIWWGRKVGSPPNPLRIELYQNDGAYEDIPPYGEDRPKGLGSPIEFVDVPTVTTVDEWQMPIQFTSKLAKGSYYWLVFHSSAGDTSNKYQVYKRDFKYDESTARYVTNGYASYWAYVGSAILKIQDLNGDDLKIYPYQKLSISTNAGSSFEQLFTAPKNMTINTVMVHVSDRFYDEGYTLIKIIRVSDNAVLAVGNLTQVLMNGLYYWVPIPLDTRITLTKSVQYKLRIEKAVGYAWQFHRIKTIPISESFGGSIDYLIGLPNHDLCFKLADFGETVFENYIHMTEICAYGAEVSKLGITDKYWVAIRFKLSYDGPFTSFAFKVLQKYGTPADFVISLYAGNMTTPTGSALESHTIAAADVPAPGWINVTSWTHSMTAGDYYWIVQRMASPSPSSGYRTARVPNPINHYWVWTDDGGATWKHMTQEGDVGDFILRATTANEVFASEPDERKVGSDTILSDSKWLAQSFNVPVNSQVKGFFVGLERFSGDRGSPVFLEVRSDSGYDTPSTTVLMKGSIEYNETTHDSLHYIDLEYPLNLTVGVKYWIVFRSTKNAGTGIPVYFFKVPQESYGGTDYHVKRSTDSGNTWSLVSDLEGDIIFAPVKPVTNLEVYNTSQLSSDIDSYHVHRWTDEPLVGWNSYLNVKTTEILFKTAEWFTGYAGRKMIAFDVTTMRMIESINSLNHNYLINFGVPSPAGKPPSGDYFKNDAMVKMHGWLAPLKASSINEYPWSSWGNPQDNTGYITPEQIRTYYLMTYPLLAPALHIFDVSSAATPNRGLSNLTQQKWSRAFGEILSRMRYYGGYYGIEKGAVNVLLIGDMDVGIVPQFLTPALNITMVGFISINGDYNLTRFRDFSQFDVIAFWAGRPSMSQLSSSAQERIKNFVNNGGGIVSAGTWATWANAMFGDGAGGDGTILPPEHVVWKPYTNDDFIDTRPHICSRDYGLGRGVHISPKKSIGKMGTDPAIYGAPRDSWLVMFTNSIFYAAGKESNIPAWWYPKYKDLHSWHDQIYYSIDGRPGEPVLLWVSNNATATNFEIHLNASFYGVDRSGWIAIDVQSWRVVAKGSGTDININVNVPAKSWMPIYIMNSTSSLSKLYSNTLVIGQNVTANTTSYTLKGPYNQTSWLILNSTKTPIRVSANNTGALPQHTQLIMLNATSTLNGWYYDEVNNLLYVKFKTTSAVIVEVVHPSEPPPVAIFTYAPSQPKVNEAVTFDASSSYDLDGNITSYQWNLGDGATITETSSTTTHNYTADGNFTVTLTVIDNDALNGTTSNVVSVSTASGQTPQQPNGTISATILTLALIPLVIVAIIAILVSARSIQNRRRKVRYKSPLVRRVTR